MSLELDALLARRRTPVTTYRLQLHHDFGFRDAAALCSYLDELGVTDAYTSPILKARPGSMHGYDITDHGALNPDLGSAEDYRVFAAALRERGMGHLLDFVPNHMAADAAGNPWWRDVLEHGPASAHAEWFDIDWTPDKPELAGKVLLPLLADQYGAVLERGELVLRLERGRLEVLAAGQPLPIDPREAPRVLRHGLAELEAELAGDPLLSEFLSVLTQLEKLPPRWDNFPERRAERRRESEVARGRLERLLTGSPLFGRHVARALAHFNGRPGEPRSFDPLHELLEAQAYRLAYWKTAGDEVNYRRFFDINDLVGVRMEREDVFAETHRLVLELLAGGDVTGLRIDHPDGLYDPARYFKELQAAFVREWARRRPGREGPLTEAETAEVDAWRERRIREDPAGLGPRPLYVAAEKILSPGETLDPHWLVDGTTGYDFLNDADRALVDPRGASLLRRVYERFTGQDAAAEPVVYDAKRLIMSTSLAGELGVLAGLLNRMSETDRRSRDFTWASLRAALREIVACFPVYRTYVSETRATADDAEIVARAVDRARRRNPAVEPSIYEFCRRLMLPVRPAAGEEQAARDALRFAMKLQQYTAPVQAKGLEDTAFYRRHVLASANEVGGDPARPASTARQFHEATKRRAEAWPRAMLATATHDSKRGEDARARIGALSEFAGEWEAAVDDWAAANRPPAGAPAPEPNDEYLFYQTLVGAWDFARGREQLPSLRERLKAYMLKAGREAKTRTSWVSPDADYERSVADLVDRALSNDSFLSRFERFARRVAEAGAVASLSRTVLKFLSPGVADMFQGCELWDLSLVDPDNRRPVDYALRRERLGALEPLLAEPAPREALAELLARWEDGRVKLFATAKLARFRRERAELLLAGSYEPLEVRGGAEDRYVAFLRELGHERAVAVAPRLAGGAGIAGMGALAAGARLEGGGRLKGLRDLFTGAVLPEDGALEGALGAFPVAVFAAPAAGKAPRGGRT